jgi:DNA mismatch endonuclease (patch repair protein)
LPGKPDIVFTRARLAVFIDGDFWHGYRLSEWEHKLSDFWRTKIRATQQRDQMNQHALNQLGWSVLRIWQHEVRDDLDAVVGRIVTSREEGLRVSSGVAPRPKRLARKEAMI